MIKDIIKKYKSEILYIVFGGLTTVLNIALYGVLYYTFGVSNSISNIAAWIVSVLFAFVTNKLWVFESKSTRLKTVMSECAKFFFFRLATGILDFVIMYVAVDVLKQNAIIFKILSNIIVIVLNYIASKLLIFKKTEEKK